MNFNDALEIIKFDKQESIIEDCCQSILNEMTLREKIYMLSGHGIGETVKNIFKYRRFYNATAYPASGCRRLGVPTFRFTDGPRGVVMRNCTCFPVSMARGAAFDEDLEGRIGIAMAKEATFYNANYFAGICINLLRHPAWGRAQETYGEDTYLLSKMGVALTKAFQERGIIACPKHYALNSIENLRFEVNAKVDEVTLHEVYLPHFKACVDAGAMSIMGAYNKVNGDYACQNKILLKDILRDQWGFKGFSSSDFVWGIYDAAKALPAGMDVEMPFTSKYGNKIKKALKKGSISIEDINFSVTNILRVMLKISLIDKPKYDKSVIASEEHRKLALEAAEKGMVLLKNKDNILPLGENIKSIAVLGRYADVMNIGDRGSSSVYPPYNVTPLQGIKNYAKDAVTVNSAKSEKLEDIIEVAKTSQYVIITAGTDFRNEGEYIVNNKMLEFFVKSIGLSAGGDRKNLRIPQSDIDLIKAVSEVNSNVIVVLFGGSGFIIYEWSDMPSGIIMNWYSGMEGGNALANIIFGKVSPSAKMPLTIANREEDYPPFLYQESPERDIEYGYYHGYTLMDKQNITPDYPFGYGLSYTTFAYSKHEVVQSGSDIEARVTIKNTGKMKGDEIVQLYAGSLRADIVRPVKLLKGFTRVTLDTDEQKTVTIKVAIDELGFYDTTAKCFKRDDEYNIMVGSSSRHEDLLTAKVRINNA